jgi:hypothetical protein
MLNDVLIYYFEEAMAEEVMKSIQTPMIVNISFLKANTPLIFLIQNSADTCKNL